MKEWKFDKNINKNDMTILAAKAEKRARDGDKQTIFYCRGEIIKSEKLVNFQKRMVVEDIAPASPSAGMLRFQQTIVKLT